jgi:hypothetical protein
MSYSHPHCAARCIAAQTSFSTVFGAEDLYFSTTVTLQNVWNETLYEVQYMRNVDPDQEQPWTGDFKTQNYVKYQPYRASDGVDRRNTSYPNMCLVVAEGVTHPQLALGLGALRSVPAS